MVSNVLGLCGKDWEWRIMNEELWIEISWQGLKYSLLNYNIYGESLQRSLQSAYREPKIMSLAPRLIGVANPSKNYSQPASSRLFMSRIRYYWLLNYIGLSRKVWITPPFMAVAEWLWRL
jgi:hypothetical protein